MPKKPSNGKIFFRSAEEKFEKLKLILEALGIDRDNKPRFLLSVYPELVSQDGSMDFSRKNKAYWSKHDRFFNECMRSPYSGDQPKDIAFTSAEINAVLELLLREKGLNLEPEDLIDCSMPDLKVLLGWSFEDATSLSKLQNDRLNNLGSLNVYSQSTTAKRMMPVGEQLDTADKPAFPVYKKGQQFTIGISLPSTFTSGDYYSALFCAVPQGFSIDQQQERFGVLIVNNPDEHDAYQVKPNSNKLMLSPKLVTSFRGPQYYCFLMLKKPFVQFGSFTRIESAPRSYFLTRNDLYQLVEYFIREVKRTSDAGGTEYGAASLYCEVVENSE